jgi:pSer/pThr/pTyr-binding forkhead associated (FHA) protein
MDQKAKLPSAREIAQELVKEMELNLYALPLVRMAPTAYYVYLHPDDYNEVELIAPRIVEECAKALTRHVAKANNEITAPKGRFRSMLRRDTDDTLPIEQPARWEIALQDDQNGEVSQGGFIIESRLTPPARPDLAGPPTIVTRSIFNDGARISHTSTTPPTTATASAGTNRTTTAAIPRVVFQFEDESGRHEIALQKETITIGRGTGQGPCDVTVQGEETISREHCVVSFGGDRFRIRDLSVWGTSVNGKPIPAALRSPEGAFLQAGTEVDLPANARIRLADSLVIQFRIE